MAQVQIVITVTDTGQLRVDGIPDNQLMGYGIIELAKDVIKQFYKTKAEQLIQPAQAIPFARQQ